MFIVLILVIVVGLIFLKIKKDKAGNCMMRNRIHKER